MSKWIVELEPGVYIAALPGDPGRTLVLENAQVFDSHPRAKRALLDARYDRPFVSARVTLAPLTDAQAHYPGGHLNSGPPDPPDCDPRC
ncbi:hypothetical protein [Rhodoferax sp.]|uniref:hypothetical protein n=1 Tax=Rhodoferax sp. TaxID=50421 RepID=UPI0027792656|nr:hypothetical protein [Rhodoferax sp.]